MGIPFFHPINYHNNVTYTFNGYNDDNSVTQATKDLPMGASVPSLGLSNKAVFDCE